MKHQTLFVFWKKALLFYGGSFFKSYFDQLKTTFICTQARFLKILLISYDAYESLKRFTEGL